MHAICCISFQLASRFTNIFQLLGTSSTSFSDRITLPCLILGPRCAHDARPGASVDLCLHLWPSLYETAARNLSVQSICRTVNENEKFKMLKINAKISSVIVSRSRTSSEASQLRCFDIACDWSIIVVQLQRSRWLASKIMLVQEM